MNKLEIVIKGMHCEHCKKRIEEALKKVENIQKLKIDLKSGKTIIKYTGKLDISIINNIITELGYEITK